jgi:hypothetical protein
MAGKKFAADFERIDEVKSNDKVLIQDSGTGIVKYATPAQINAMFDQLVADIQTAIDAKTDAEAAFLAALGAKSDAEAAKSDAVTAKTDAVSAKTAAETAANDAANALAGVNEELAALAALVDNAGDHKAISYDAEEAYKVCGFRTVISGAGVPSLETIPEQFGIPAFIGQLYIDTSAASGGLYYAVGTSSISDWKNA